MKKVISLLMLAVILVTACQASSPPTSTATAVGADPFGAVRAHIERLVADGKVPSITVAVARDDKIIW